MKFEEPKTKPYLQQLIDFINEELHNEFKKIYLSHNLVDTITIEENNGGFILEIPAERYNIRKFKKDGVIVYNGRGSYADEVDESGGFSGTHTGYVDKAISKAMRKWKKWLSSQQLELRKYKNFQSATRVTIKNQQRWYRGVMKRKVNREMKIYQKNEFRGKKKIARTIRGHRSMKQSRVTRTIRSKKQKR